ncbi:hypothetical protein ACS0TY_034766 [Phlomoides rotata]
MSGLSVNFHKSRIVGININQRIVEETTRFLGCEVEQLPLSYLGLQVGISHWKISAWSNLVARVRRGLAKWKDKNLSFGGKITLIQSVLSAIPNYCLSFYRIPKLIIKELISIQRDFLWGGCEERSKIPWIKWEVVCSEKSERGLGIRELGRFNRALLSKWIWRFKNEPARLWDRVIKSKNGELELGEMKVDIKVFERNRWRGRYNGNMSGWWRELCNLYVGDEGRGVRQDIFRVRWRHTSDGLFSTASAYQKFGKTDETKTEVQEQKIAYNKLWNSYASRRYQVIVWKILHNRLPTKERLQRMGIIPGSGDIKCAMCSEENETSIHLVANCRIVHNIWTKIYEWLGIAMVPYNDPRVNLLQDSEILGHGKKKRIASTIRTCTVWAIWNCRNKAIFSEEPPNVNKMIGDIKARS